MAEREPPGSDGRLSDVNPGTMSSADHAQHDRWLVARAASHDTDLTPAELASARALLDGCPACASLAADITTIAHATAVSLAPARPRDFRLSPRQAAAARGGVLDRLARWLASPRSTMLRPLAGASLAIGIVLVAVGPSIQGPLQAQAPAPNAGVAAPVGTVAAEGGAPTEGTAQAADTATPDGAHIMDMQLVPQGSGAANPEAQGSAPRTPRHRRGWPKTSPPARRRQRHPAPGRQRRRAHGQVDVRRRCRSRPRPWFRRPDPQALQRDPGRNPQGDRRPRACRCTGRRRRVGSPRWDGPGRDRVKPDPVADDTSKALVLLGIVLAGTGILVLVLTWLARRTTRDPPCRADAGPADTAEPRGT